MRVIEFFASRYADSSLQTRKKSRILAAIAMAFGLVSLALAAVMAATGAPLVAAVFVGLALFCSAVLALLRLGKYDLASSAFLYGLFAAMFVAIKFDQYRDVYETYVFGTLGCFLLLVATLVADRPRQAVVICLLGLAAIEALYWLDAYPKDGRVTLLAVQNLTVSSLMVALGGAVAACLVGLTGGLVRKVERDARTAERSCEDLNAAMGEAQLASQRVGESLSASVARSMEAIEGLRIRVAEISGGMDELDVALEASSSANRGAESCQEEVKAALASCSEQVERASAAIEEMAAAAASLAAQASAKRDAVRKLVEGSAAGEGLIASMGESMDRISESAKRVAELGAIIGDVAERTNLLGMNASIEAAHAGAAGRGFAVVANEIRALSVETSESARVMEDTLGEALAGIASTAARNAEAMASFRRITESVRGVGLMIEELLASVQELSAGSGEAVAAVAAVSDLTRSTEAAVNKSCDGMEDSLRGMDAVAGIASRVRAETSAISGSFDEMLRGSGEVRRLGEENLGTIQGLKSRLDSFSRGRTAPAAALGGGAAASRGIRIKRPARPARP